MSKDLLKRKRDDLSGKSKKIKTNNCPSNKVHDDEHIENINIENTNIESTNIESTNIEFYYPPSDKLKTIFGYFNETNSIEKLPEYLTKEDDMDYLSAEAYWSYFGGCGIPNKSNSTGELLTILDNMQQLQDTIHTFTKILYWIIAKEERDYTKTILAMAEGPLEGHMYAIMVHVYRNGILGCEIDHKKAYTYAVKSAKCGNLIGKAWMGSYLLQEEVVDKDFEKGIQLLIESADAGFPMAQHIIGSLYICMNPTKENILKGLKYIEMAADQFYNRSLVRLGDFLRIGQIPFKNENGICDSVKIFDKNKGFYYFKTAADNGDKHGMFAVATMYKNGEGVEQNIYKAKEYYRMAIDAGYKITFL